ncbi:MAG: siderophore ABC transporter substrate-binding protein [Acidimicrobiales bacterium]
MSINRFLRLLALLAAFTLAAAACGSSDDTATTEAEASDTTTTEAADTESADEADVAEADSTDAAEADDAADEAAAEEMPTEVQVTTYSGATVTAPYDPATIVVMDFAALDTIDALGFGDRVVGLPLGTALPPHLDAYSGVENIGTLFEPDFEAINALGPDLIVAGGRSAAVVPDLAEIAPTIDYSMGWGSAAFLESIVTNTRAIAQVLGVEAEAIATLEAMSAAAQDIAAQAADDGTGLVLLTTGGEVSAYGPSDEGRFDFVYGVFGITPALEQLAIDNHGDSISFEFLAETNPDILIVLDRDAAIGAEGEAAQAILDNDLVNGTNAAQNGNILYVDTAKWYLSYGGLNSVQTMIDELDSIVD